MNTAKSMNGMGFKPITQVELSNWIIKNLQQFKLKPTSKLVLLYLASCYNPKNADVFPKQKTIALQLGISERSVISAILELHKEGLIISERKYINRYRFTSRILNQGAKVDFFEPEEIAPEAEKIAEQTENFSPTCIEQSNEQLKEQTVKVSNNQISISDFAKLKDYAASKGAKNPTAYAKAIINSGNADSILKQENEKEKIKENAAKRIAETKALIEASKVECGEPTQETKEALKALMQRLKNSKR